MSRYFGSIPRRSLVAGAAGGLMGSVFSKIGIASAHADTKQPADLVKRDGTPASLNRTDVGSIPSGTGTVARTLQDKNRETVSVKDFGAACDGTTNDTSAVQKALTYACSVGGTLEFPGLCAVYSEVIANGSMVKLKGTRGKLNSGLTLKHARAKFTIGSASNTYQGAVEDFAVYGNNLATTLVEMKNAGEFSIKNMLLNGSTGIGLKTTGAITGILKILGLHSNGVANPVRIEGHGVIWFDGCNFFDSDKIFTFGAHIFDVVIRDTWMENYNYAADLDSTSGHVDVFGLRFRDCFFQNVKGGAGKTSRILRSYAPNNTYRNRLYGFEISGGNIYHTASAHLIEVKWNGTNTFAGLNKVQGGISGVMNSSPAGITSFIKSDVTATDLPYVDLKYDSKNINYNAIPISYDTKRTGGIEKFAANSATPSVASQAPAFETANAAPTTITNFINGYGGQVVRVIVRDANTTFKFAGSLTFSGNAGADYTASSGNVLSFIFDGAAWLLTGKQ